MIRKKEAVRKKIQHSTSPCLRANFKQLRSTVKHMIRESRTRFFESLQQDSRENPKRFWSIFKLSDKVRSVPEQMSTPFNSQDTATRVAPNRKVVSSSVDIAEAFNDNFTSVFSSDTEESCRQVKPIDGPVLEEISLSPSEVVAALRSLHVSKASGPDGISARLLKKQLNRWHYL